MKQTNAKGRIVLDNVKFRYPSRPDVPVSYSELIFDLSRPPTDSIFFRSSRESHSRWNPERRSLWSDPQVGKSRNGTRNAILNEATITTQHTIAGSGKSTIVSLLLRYYDLEGGRVSDDLCCL